MGTMGACTDIELSPTLSAITRLKESIATFSEEQQLPHAVSFELTLALEEAVANIIQHGNLPQAGGRISLKLTSSEEQIDIELRDNGRPFDPLQAEPPDLGIPFMERDVGGLGIFYLRQLMDEICYRHENNENVLKMKKQIT